MKSFGRKATIVVAAVACLAVLVGGWVLLIQPTRSSISKTKAQTALQKKVPNQVELPTILRSMQYLAITSGVKLLSITPGAPEPLENAPGISSVAVQLSVSGGYAEIEQFDSALEGLQR